MRRVVIGYLVLSAACASGQQTARNETLYVPDTPTTAAAQERAIDPVDDVAAKLQSGNIGEAIALAMRYRSSGVRPDYNWVRAIDALQEAAKRRRAVLDGVTSHAGQSFAHLSGLRDWIAQQRAKLGEAPSPMSAIEPCAVDVDSLSDDKLGSMLAASLSESLCESKHTQVLRIEIATKATADEQTDSERSRHGRILVGSYEQSNPDFSLALADYEAESDRAARLSTACIVDNSYCLAAGVAAAAANNARSRVYATPRTVRVPQYADYTYTEKSVRIVVALEGTVALITGYGYRSIWPIKATVSQVLREYRGVDSRDPDPPSPSDFSAERTIQSVVSQAHENVRTRVYELLYEQVDRLASGGYRLDALDARMQLEANLGRTSTDGDAAIYKTLQSILDSNTALAKWKDQLPSVLAVAEPEPPVTPTRLPSSTGSTQHGFKKPTKRVAREQIARQARAAVVMIATSAGTGSGFFAGPRTIVTNWHVVEAGAPIRAIAADGSDLGPVEISFADIAHDIAVLSTAKEASHWLQIRPDLPAAGQEVVAAGFPYGQAFGVTRGIVSTVLAEVLRHDASINPGNSGGPLIDGFGYVVGVNTFKVTTGEGLGFAVLGRRVLDILATPEDMQEDRN